MAGIGCHHGRQSEKSKIATTRHSEIHHMQRSNGTVLLKWHSAELPNETVPLTLPTTKHTDTIRLSMSNNFMTKYQKLKNYS
jgi:hypothetical protein